MPADDGARIYIDATVPGTALPCGIHISVLVPQINVYDFWGHLLLTVHLSESILANQNIVQIKQSIRLELIDLDEIARIANRVAIGGKSEIMRMSFRLNFTATFNIMNVLTIKSLTCGKTICVRDAIEKAMAESDFCVAQSKLNTSLKQEIVNQTIENVTVAQTITDAMRVMNEAIFIPGIGSTKFLLPDAFITPLPITPRLARSITGGLEISFETPPGLNFTLGDIRFDAVLNGSAVAHCIVQGLVLSSKKNYTITVIVEPCVTSANPIKGLTSTVSGMLKGAATGALNGFLYGDWGAGSSILSIENLVVTNEHNLNITWMTKIFSAMKLDYDLALVNRGASLTRKASGEFKDVVKRLVSDIYEAKCIIM